MQPRPLSFVTLHHGMQELEKGKRPHLGLAHCQLKRTDTGGGIKNPVTKGTAER